jgi:antitoxin component YwqK of YwqJK toxin-antitoxin module
MKAGKAHGLMKEYSASGQLLLECTYNNGLRLGPCQGWYENGRPQFKSVYQEDGQWSEYTDWYESGVERNRGRRTSAKATIEWKSFDEQGRRLSVELPRFDH